MMVPLPENEFTAIVGNLGVWADYTPALNHVQRFWLDSGADHRITLRRGLRGIGMYRVV